MTTKNLKALLPDSYQYHISKLYEGYYSGYLMVKADIELLIAALQRLRSELDQRAISTHKITSLLDDMDHVLANLLAWEAAGTLEGNRDTKVFVDALNQYFNDLVIMLDDQSQPV